MVAKKNLWVFCFLFELTRIRRDIIEGITWVHAYLSIYNNSWQLSFNSLINHVATGSYFANVQQRTRQM